jgi:hypothetical protein
MEYASSKGELMSSVISFMYKHKEGKIENYVTKPNPVMIKVMTSCPSSEDYFLPRTQLEPPPGSSRDDIINRVFPLLPGRNDERELVDGDKSKACKNFSVLAAFPCISDKSGRHPLNS